MVLVAVFILELTSQRIPLVGMQLDSDYSSSVGLIFFLAHPPLSECFKPS